LSKEEWLILRSIEEGISLAKLSLFVEKLKISEKKIATCFKKWTGERLLVGYRKIQSRRVL
jgi:hypothetical protein